MLRNWFKYFGCLGFLGFLSFITGNYGFFGFFGFFGLFGLAREINDERFTANLNKAARNAFLVSVLFYVVTIFVTVLRQIDLSFYAFIINFMLMILVFTFSFQYYDRSGR